MPLRVLQSSLGGVPRHGVQRATVYFRSAAGGTPDGALRLSPATGAHSEFAHDARRHLEGLSLAELRQMCAATLEKRNRLPRSGAAWSEFERGLELLRQEAKRRNLRGQRQGLPAMGRPPDPAVTLKRRVDAALAGIYIDYAAARQRLLQTLLDAEDHESVLARLATTPSDFGRVKPMRRDRQTLNDDLLTLAKAMGGDARFGR